MDGQTEKASWTKNRQTAGQIDRHMGGQNRVRQLYRQTQMDGKNPVGQNSSTDEPKRVRQLYTQIPLDGKNPVGQNRQTIR